MENFNGSDASSDCGEKKQEPCAIVNVYCGGDKPKPCKDKCPAEFAQAYSIKQQTLAPSLGVNMPGDPVLLESIKVSTANIDCSMAGINGELMVKVAGWYEVSASACAFLNPIPVPLPVWTISMFKNGALMPITFSNVPLSPAQGSNQMNVETFEYFAVGDKIKLANTSTNPLFLVAPPLGVNPGTNVQTSSAFLKLSLVKCEELSRNPEINKANESFLALLNSANLLFVASSTVDISQNPTDALTAQAEANNLLAGIVTASADLLAAAPFATPLSLANANANMASLSGFANASLAAANNVVANLNPANTQIALLAAGQTQSAASLLAVQPLVEA